MLRDSYQKIKKAWHKYNFNFFFKYCNFTHLANYISFFKYGQIDTLEYKNINLAICKLLHSETSK